MGYDGNGGENIESPSGIPTAPAQAPARAPARSVAHGPGKKNSKERAFGAPLSFLSLTNVMNVMDDLSSYRIRYPKITPSRFGLSLLKCIVTSFRRISDLLKDLYKSIKDAIPGFLRDLFKKAEASVAKDDVPQTGGGSSFFKKPAKYNELLYSTAYFPAILTLLIFLYFLVVLWWQYVLWVVGKINKYIGTNFKLPNIILKKKTAQIIYSIFFVITSLFLMLYLCIDFYYKIGPELDIIQILKQGIGASYILWPIAVLIVGSGIAKAFYKIACSGNKTNVLKWSKIIESFAIYILCVFGLFTLLFLLRPVKFIFEKLPNIVKTWGRQMIKFIAVSLKLMVIYILLRMVTVMIENVISDRFVFIISILNKDIERPPVNCNAEKEKKKQTETARLLEKFYMYISGFIVFVIVIIIIILQCPHPLTGTVNKANNIIGAVLQILTDIPTRLIVENSYGTIKKKKLGSAFNRFSPGQGKILGKGKILGQGNKLSASVKNVLGDRGEGEALLDNIRQATPPATAPRPATPTRTATPTATAPVTQPAPNTHDGPADGSAGEEYLYLKRQQASAPATKTASAPARQNRQVSQRQAPAPASSEIDTSQMKAEQRI